MGCIRGNLYHWGSLSNDKSKSQPSEEKDRNYRYRELQSVMPTSMKENKSLTLYTCYGQLLLCTRCEQLFSELYLDDVGLLKSKSSHLTPLTTSLQKVFFVTLIHLMWQGWTLRQGARPFFAKHNLQGIRKQLLKCSPSVLLIEFVLHHQRANNLG